MSHQSLPSDIASQLRNEITAKNRPGDRLPTVLDMARRFDVSKHTISTALDILFREGVIEKWPGSGVYVAEHKKAWRVGVVSELNVFDLRISHYFRSLMGAVNLRLREHGVVPLLYCGSQVGVPESPDTPTCPEFWADVDARRLDGGVIIDVQANDYWWRRAHRCPVPLVGAMTDFSTRVDQAGILRAAVRRLVANGCRRLGLMSWHSEELFRQAVAECGLDTSDRWIRSDINPIQRGAGWDEFREIWLTAGEKPDGLVILDDLLYLDAQAAITELGVRVPADLQLAVQTNRGSHMPLVVPVTALEIDPAASAAALVDLLLKRLRGETLPPTSVDIDFHEVQPQRPAQVPGQRVTVGN